MQFTVTILGAGSATPTLGRHPSAQLISYENENFLIDCGEGTQMRLLEYKIRPSRLKAIFISHLHGDHYFGLIALLSSLNLGGRTDDLHLFGPRGLDEILLLQFKYSQTPLHFTIHFTAVDTTQHTQVFDHPCFTVHTIPLQHRVPCAGYLFREKPHKRKLIKEKISDQMSYECLKKLKNAEHIYDESGAILYNFEEYTLPAPAPRSYAYCSDTRYYEQLSEYIKGVDLLYHEATFMEDLGQQAYERYHATAKDAARTAHKAGVGRLLLGHFSSRYKEFSGFLQEAQSIFAATAIAEEGKTFAVQSTST